MSYLKYKIEPVEMYICSGVNRGCDQLDCEHRKPHDIAHNNWRFDECWKTPCDMYEHEDNVICVPVPPPILSDELFEI
jgi:hypothetical protein